MQETGLRNSAYGADRFGLKDLKAIHWNHTAPLLYEHAIVRPSWIYGPSDRALNRFVAFHRLLPFVPVVGDGKQRLQPVFIDDVTELKLAEAGLTELYTTEHSARLELERARKELAATNEAPTPK